MTDAPDFINGPWRAEGWEGLVVNDNGGFTVLACPGGSGPVATLVELKARSRLIAAAPEMLAALRLARKLFEVALPQFDWGKSALSGEAIRLLNEGPGVVANAIAKAEGRSHVG